MNVPAPDDKHPVLNHDAARATAGLRRMGVKLAHPDDRCVRGGPDGHGHLICTCSLLFDDRPGLGDLIAVGSPARRGQVVIRQDDHGVERVVAGYRIVRVTEASWRPTDNGVSREYAFAPTPLTWPATRRCWWHRLLRLRPHQVTD